MYCYVIKSLETRHSEHIKEKDKKIGELEEENNVLKKLIDKMTIQHSSDVTKEKPKFMTSSRITSRPATTSSLGNGTAKSSSSRTPYMERKFSGSRSEGLPRSSRLQTPKYSPSSGNSGFGSRKYQPSTVTSYRNNASSVPTSQSSSSSKRPAFFRTAWKFWCDVIMRNCDGEKRDWMLFVGMMIFLLFFSLLFFRSPFYVLCMFFCK